MRHNLSPRVQFIAKVHGLMYPPGARVELLSTENYYDDRLNIGDRGTVRFVDTIGNVHIKWDCGIKRVAIYGMDKVERVF